MTLRTLTTFVLWAALPAGLYAYPDGPPPGVTGAPQEGTCRMCHNPPGSGGGKVEIAFPRALTYSPGVKQQWTITITDPDARLYGFELSVRKAGDNSQAGTLVPALGEVDLQVICADGEPRPAGGCPASVAVEYVQHNQPRQTNSFRVEWTPPPSAGGPVRVYVAANAANGDDDETFDDIYTANYTLSDAAQLTAPPRITSAGIVNAATSAPGLSPGAFVSIFGENLAPATRSWDGAIQGIALPAQLEGVSVIVAGRPAYLAYISPSQLNVLLPAEEMVGSAEVRVTTPMGSASVAAVAQRYAPGFFPSSLERRYVAAVDGSGVPIAAAGIKPGITSRPARPGEEIVLWGTGFGPTVEQVPSGQVVAKPYPLAPGDLRVTVGGKAASVTFAGVTIAGVTQINIVVPPDLLDGEHAVHAEIAGTRTPDGLVLAVAHPTGALAAIEVAYRLDPWLISGTYGGGFWASPAVLGPATQGTATFSLDIRSQGVGGTGQPIDISPQWIPSDPDMVAVVPGADPKQVKITLRRPGLSALRISSGGVSKELGIKASMQGEVMVAEISQQ